MRHAFIATPAHGGDVRCEYAGALIQTTALLLRSGMPYTHQFIIGNALVHDARNRLVSWFMASQATDLLFIDADIAWEAKDALKLIMSPHDVIGGAYRRKADHEEVYNIANPRPGATQLLQVDYIGTGFLKISRKAIEKLIKAHPDKKYTGPAGEECWGLFEAPVENGGITGEDALFCRRWRDIGGKVFCDPDMTLHHIGTKAYSGNFAQVMASQARVA